MSKKIECINRDREYSEQRNKLLKMAASYANRYTNGRKYKNNEEFSAEWNREYHRKIGELWVESQR